MCVCVCVCVCKEGEGGVRMCVCVCVCVCSNHTHTHNRCGLCVVAVCVLAPLNRPGTFRAFWEDGHHALPQ